MSHFSFLGDPSEFLNRLATSMLHFLWQGTAIAIVLWATLVSLRNYSAGIRYATSVAALFLLSACIPLNLLLLDTPAATFFPADAQAVTSAPIEPDIIVTRFDSVTQDLGSNRAPATAPMSVSTRPVNLASESFPMVAPATSREDATATNENVAQSVLRTSPPEYGSYIVGAWLIGVALMLFRLMRGIHRAHRLRSSSRLVNDSALLKLTAEQATQLGMKIIPVLRYCEHIAVPVVIGLIRPVVLLPPGILTGLAPAQLRAILCHELAHIYRLDHWIHLFQHVSETILFFHPAVWWVNHRISTEREICCDDVVLAAGCERIEYAGALLQAAEMFSQRRGRGIVPGAAALRATGSSQSEFGRRIRRLLGESQSGSAGTRPWAIVCIIPLLLLIAAIAFRGSESTASDEAGTVTATESSAKNDVTLRVPSESEPLSWNDSPQWGRNSRRNHVAGVSLPLYFNLNDRTNVKWTATLGATVYNTPVVANGKVFIGSSNAGYNTKYPQNETDIGSLVCFEQSTGKFVWQYSVPAIPPSTGKFDHQFWPETGITSAPVVEQGRVEWIDGRYQKNRLWLMNNRAEVVCLDAEGFSNGNDGPFLGEVDAGPHDADVIWKYDLRKELDVTPAYSACSSPTLAGDLLIVNSSHSPNPLGIVAPDAGPNKTPAFLAFNRNTGELIWQDNSPGDNILDVAWSSPAFDVIDGVPQAIFAGGDGWLYSFDARDITDGKTTLLWKFDCNPKSSVWTTGGGPGTRNTIVATPVIHGNNVYITTGRNPENGEGPGLAFCIDATKRGDVSEELVFSKSDPTTPVAHRRDRAIAADSDEYAAANPNSAVVWKFAGEDLDGDGEISHGELMNRSTSCVTIKDGFAVVADSTGYVHCLNAETGQCYWYYDMLAAVHGTPMISDNRIYIGDEDGDATILALAKDLSVIAEFQTDASINGSLVAGFFNGNRLLIPSQGKLHCIEAQSSTNQMPNSPRQWQKSEREGSVIAWQSERNGLHFAIYHDGFMASGFGSSWNSNYWNINGHVALGTDHRQKVKVAYNCQSPNYVTIENKKYDLANGRLFGVDADGRVVQLHRTKRFHNDDREDQVRKAGEAVDKTRQQQQKNNADKAATNKATDGRTSSTGVTESPLSARPAADTESTELRTRKTEYLTQLSEAFQEYSATPESRRAAANVNLVNTLLQLEEQFRGTADGFNALWNIQRQADVNRLFGHAHLISVNTLRETVARLRRDYLHRPELYTCFPFLIHNCPFEESELLLQEAREENEFSHTEAASCFHFAEWYQWKATLPERQNWLTQMRPAVPVNQQKWIDDYVAATKSLGDVRPQSSRRSAITAAEFVSGQAGEVRMPKSVPDIDAAGKTALILQSGLEMRHRQTTYPTYAERAEALLFDLEKLSPGETAPDISGQNQKNQPMRLSHFRGRPTLLIFSDNHDNSFAQLDPVVRALQQNYGTQLNVVSVRCDKSTAELQQEISSGAISWDCWHDGFDGPISNRWNIRALPATFLLDQDGVIQQRDVPPPLLNTSIQRLLN